MGELSRREEEGRERGREGGREGGTVLELGLAVLVEGLLVGLGGEPQRVEVLEGGRRADHAVLGEGGREGGREGGGG